MTRLVVVLALMLTGCIHLPDRVTFSVTGDSETGEIRAFTVGTSLPIRWNGEK